MASGDARRLRAAVQLRPAPPWLPACLRRPSVDQRQSARRMLLSSWPLRAAARAPVPSPDDSEARATSAAGRARALPQAPRPSPRVVCALLPGACHLAVSRRARPARVGDATRARRRPWRRPRGARGGASDRRVLLTVFSAPWCTPAPCTPPKPCAPTASGAKRAGPAQTCWPLSRRCAGLVLFTNLTWRLSTVTVRRAGLPRFVMVARAARQRA